MKAEIMANKEWKRHYKRASRSSGTLARHMRCIHQATVTELANRNRLVDCGETSRITEAIRNRFRT